MTNINFIQSRTVTWGCTLCQSQCTMAEKDFTRIQLAYVCTCGRVYTVIFAQDITIEESSALDAIFTIERRPGGIAVRLTWDQDKGQFAGIDEHRNWSEALDRAIGSCWRLYSEEILAHLWEHPTEQQTQP